MSGRVLVIQGPTASGKTDVAIQLALRFGGEILSADSRQFYREMIIGTAKPDDCELQRVPHHFINSLSISDTYSAGRFERDALELIGTLHANGKLPIVAGGSGLYVKALLEGLDDLPHDADLRLHLQAIFAEKGLEALQQLMRKLDQDYFASMDQCNPVRLMRGIELVQSSGKTMARLHKGVKATRNFSVVKVGLELPRETLYARIDARVDEMVLRGLVNEVKSLKDYSHLQALQTVGYTELFQYLDGQCTLENAIALIKRNSRRYAKRQLTWLRKDENIKWFHPSQVDEMVNFISL